MCDGERGRIRSGRGRVVSLNWNGPAVKLAEYPAFGYPALVLGQIPGIQLVAYPINRISEFSEFEIRLDIRPIYPYAEKIFSISIYITRCWCFSSLFLPSI